MKRFIPVLLLIVLAMLMPFAAAEQSPAVIVSLSTHGGNIDVIPTRQEDGLWLFLPSFVQDSTLSVSVDGRPAILRIAEGGGDFIENGEIFLEGESVPCMMLQVMRSENLRALFLFSDDPVSQGRVWLEDCPLHENRTTGSMALVDAQGHVNNADTIYQLRGRGNGSWRACVKKSYQFKLTNRADLLNTGDRDERNRTWVLVGLARDHAMLRDRVTLDLALEMGMEQTSRSEHVDLYYDGDYRGTYLLAEKVEVNEGRVDVLDFDKLLEEWNSRAGQVDLAALPSASSVNRFGNRFDYIEGVVDNGTPDAGAYFLEIENEYSTLSDRCWFRLSDQMAIACKNPENASESMMRYISEFMEEAFQTLLNRGVHPENGRTMQDYFDVEAWARIALLQEMSANLDGFLASTYFILPAGSRQLQPGPVWDFDLAYHDLPEEDLLHNLKDENTYLTKLYSVPVFRNELQKILLNELTPLVENILLGDETGRYLRPLDSYASEIAASMRMNYRIWDVNEYEAYAPSETPGEDLENMRTFLRERLLWMQQEIGGWSQTSPDRIDLWAKAMYTLPETTLNVQVRPWSNVKVLSQSVELLSEADEENYAVYQLDLLLSPLDSLVFEQPSVTLNGSPVSCEILPDGTLQVFAAFEDPSYRPVDYYGEDIGWVYNYDDYLRNHPEVIDECGDDPEDVMNYFVDEGMYLGHKGNAFFEPALISFCKRDLQDFFGDQWDLYYWEFISYGYEDWMASVTLSQGYFRPVFTEVPEL